MTWPSFIVPSAATICSAVSSWRLASAFSRPSSPRATFVARVPICLAACVAASRPTFDERLMRDVGMASFLAIRESARRPGAGGREGPLRAAALDLRAGDAYAADRVLEQRVAGEHRSYVALSYRALGDRALGHRALGYQEVQHPLGVP